MVTNVNTLQVPCALRDHLLKNGGQNNFAHLSHSERQIVFQYWVVFYRNALPDIFGKEQLLCPMLWCRDRFEDLETCLHHLLSCPWLLSAWYWCSSCQRPENFTGRKPSSNSYLKNDYLRKPSRLQRAVSFFKHFGHRHLAEAKPLAPQSYDNSHSPICELPGSLPEGTIECSPMSRIPFNPSRYNYYQHSPFHNPGVCQNQFVRHELSSRETELMRSELLTPEPEWLEKMRSHEKSKAIDGFLDDASVIELIREAAELDEYPPSQKLGLPRPDSATFTSTDWSDRGSESRSDACIQGQDYNYQEIDRDQPLLVQDSDVANSLPPALLLDTRHWTWPSLIYEKPIESVHSFLQCKPLSMVSGYTSHSTSSCSSSMGLVNSPSENSNATLTPDSTISSSSVELPSPASSSTQSPTSDNTISCVICGIAFRGINQDQRSNLKRHIRFVHNNFSVACPQCFKEYTRPDNLKKHLREKHELSDSFWKENFGKKAQ